MHSGRWNDEKVEKTLSIRNLILTFQTGLSIYLLMLAQCRSAAGKGFVRIHYFSQFSFVSAWCTFLRTWKPIHTSCHTDPTTDSKTKNLNFQKFLADLESFTSLPVLQVFFVVKQKKFSTGLCKSTFKNYG